MKRGRGHGPCLLLLTESVAKRIGTSGQRVVSGSLSGISEFEED